MADYHYDENHTRYELVSACEGRNYNWLFIPGGPGADSRYLRNLVGLLELPGNVWLIDLPGNGDNIEGIGKDYDYDQWFSFFLAAVNRFENPVLVGHSFGGTFPLLFPELEDRLKGFVILNGAPSFWLFESIRFGQIFHLPNLSKQVLAFTLKKNQKTFTAILKGGIPYGFTPETTEAAHRFLETIPFPYQPCYWWNFKILTSSVFETNWIPEKVPTLIVGARHDFVMPFSLFRNDVRFQRQILN